MKITVQQLAGMIDHTMLKIEAKYSDIEKLCLEAEKYHFVAVAIHPVNVPLAAKMLKGTGVKVCVALSFHLGAYPPDIKEFECRDAVKNGADELDMVMNIGALKAGSYDVIRKEVDGLVRAADGRTTKLILETCLLTDEEKVKACEIAKVGGVDFVKTSTGFSSLGATVSDVRLMRQTVGPKMGVKASGGIRTLEAALDVVEAGADRLGVSASVEIINGFR